MLYNHRYYLIHPYIGNPFKIVLLSPYRANIASKVTYTDHISIISNPPLFLFSPHLSPYKAEFPQLSFKTENIQKKGRKEEDTYTGNTLFSRH